MQQPARNMQFPSFPESTPGQDSLHHLRTIQSTREALSGLRQSPSLVADIQLRTARRDTERLLARHLRLLGAAVVDAWEAGPDALRAFFGLATAPQTPEPIEQHVSDAPHRATATASEAPEPSMRPLVVTPDVCKALETRMREGQAGGATEPASAATAMTPHETARMVLLGRIVAELGPVPANLRGKRPAETEAARIGLAIEALRRHAGELGREINHALTTLATARIRALQDAIAAHLRNAEGADMRERTETLVKALTAHSAHSQPGTVHGLARHHKAKRATWADDARAAQAAVDAMLPNATQDVAIEAPEKPASRDATLSDAFRRLNEKAAGPLETAELISELWLLLHTYRVAETDPRVVGFARRLGARLPAEDLGAAGLGELARALKYGAANDDDGDTDDGLATCAHRDATRGGSAVIVGGDRRPEREAVIQKALGLASLRWIPTDQGMRQVDALEASIRAGKVDFVFVLQRFVSHSISDRLFDLKSTECRVVLAESYGVAAICRALDRFLGPPAA